MHGQHGAQQAAEVCIAESNDMKQNVLLTVRSAVIENFAATTAAFSQTVNCKAEDDKLPCLSVEDFLTAEASKQHLLIMMADLQVHERSRIVASYLDKKLRHPELTACFILPYGSQHARRLQHMQMIKQMPSLKSMLVTDAELPANPLRLRAACQVRYDPAISVQKDVLTSVWNANLAGISGRILLDSGACQNFIDEGFCQRNGIKIAGTTQQKVILGDGCESAIIGECRIPIKIQHFGTSIDFAVCALSAQFDAVLGETWFRSAQAMMEYSTAGLSAVSVWKGTRRLRLLPRLSHVSKAGEKHPVMSAMQFQRAVKQNCTWFMGMVAWEDNDEDYDDGMAGRKSKLEVGTAADTECTGSNTEGLIPAANLQRILQKREKVFPDKLPAGAE